MALAATSCTWEEAIQDSHSGPEEEVDTHFIIQTVTPTQVDTRAVTIDGKVNNVALLVFEQENGIGEFLYQYTVIGEITSQLDDSEADFTATLPSTHKSVRLLTIANFADGTLDDIIPGDTESEVRKALTGKISIQASGMPMSGVKTLESISPGMGSVTIPMLRSLAKVTIDLAPAIDNFKMTSIKVYRAVDEFQFFATPGTVLDEDTTPRATAVSIPDETTPLFRDMPTPLENSYANFLTENVVNDVVDETTCIVVGGEYDGSEIETFYRLDFEGHVLRNFWQQFIITEITGPGWNNPDDAANNASTHIEAIVLPWNGGSNSEYHFGKDRYVILSKPELTLGTTVGDRDELYITTSGVPFTITSESYPDAGEISTADEGSKGLYTETMNFIMGTPPHTSIEPGQQQWLLVVDAVTSEMTGDYLDMEVLGGLMSIRIPVRRTLDFDVERIGELETVPHTGTPDRTTGNHTHYVEYRITIPESMTWSAEITAQGWTSGSSTDPHPAYLLDPATGLPAGTTISGQSTTATLRIGFDELFYPTINESPKATIKISIDGMEENEQTIVVTQDAIVTPVTSLDVLDIHSGYGSINGQAASYLRTYTSWIDEPRLYGTSGHLQTTVPIAISLLSATPAQIDPKYRYVHIGGQYILTNYPQSLHDVINSYWQQYGNERIFVFATDYDSNSIFANAPENTSKRTTVLSMLGIDFKDTNGGISDAKVTTDATAQTSAIFRYLTEDGPFGPVPDFASFEFYYDSINSGVDAESLPETAIPIIFNEDGVEGGCVMLFIDPANGIVYWGDSQFFDVGIPLSSTYTYLDADEMVNGMGDGSAATYDRFLANIIAYVVNCAQYGSGFADLFLPQNAAMYDAAFKKSEP